MGMLNTDAGLVSLGLGPLPEKRLLEPGWLEAVRMQKLIMGKECSKLLRKPGFFISSFSPVILLSLLEGALPIH